MFGSNDSMPGNKMLRLFIIQAISSFVSKDYQSGLHYLNEIKTSYAEFNSTLNPTLKSLAKEIIQSLDMFAPGATSEVFMGVNEVARTPQEELRQAFSGANQAEPSQEVQQPAIEQPVQEPAQQPTIQPGKSAAQPASVTSDLQGLLERRKMRRNKK